MSSRGPATALVAIVLTLTVAWGAVELTHSGARRISLAALVLNQQQYLGQEVTTSGMVRRFTDPDGSSYYMLTDLAQDRVIIRPAVSAAHYLHRRVTVTGTFSFDPRAGRILTARHIARRQGGASAAGRARPAPPPGGRS